MNIMALFAAPLSYLPFSSAKPGKNQKATQSTASRLKKSKPEKKTDPVQLKPYRGTSIVFTENACDAVKAIGKNRFLLADGDTPILPLAACDASRCTCKYMHYDDRRDYDDDRRLTATIRTDLYEDSGNANRRLEKRGRRKSDI